LEAHRAKVASWVEQGVTGTAIPQALVRQHGFGVSGVNYPERSTTILSGAVGR